MRRQKFCASAISESEHRVARRPGALDGGTGQVEAVGKTK
jgi:hypothetical protein